VHTNRKEWAGEINPKKNIIWKKKIIRMGNAVTNIILKRGGDKLRGTRSSLGKTNQDWVQKTIVSRREKDACEGGWGGKLSPGLYGE